jgi:ATP-binding cassette subfamily B protein
MFRVLRPYRRRWMYSVVLSFIQVSLHIQFPLILQAMVSNITSGSEHGLDQCLWWLIIVFAAEGVVMFLRLGHLNNYMANHIIYDLRVNLVKKILRHSYAFIDAEESGDLISTMISDINQVKNFLSSQITYFARNVFQLVGLIVIMLLISPILMLALASILPFLALVVYVYYKRIHPITFRQRETFGDLTARLAENLDGVHLVRAFANEDVEFQHFDRINTVYRNTSKQVGRMASAYGPAINLVIRFGWIIVLGLGGYLILTHAFGSTMTIDQLFAFIPALNLLIEPVQFITFMSGEYGRIAAAFDRIKRIEELDIDIVEKPDAVALPLLRGDVSFQNVAFAYDGVNPVIKNVSFDVPAGKTIALLGATGAGKSTIINLLCRFYDVSSGSIVLDGTWDVRDVNLDSYRSQIGIVAQETFLFQQSILENLTHGLESYTMEEVRAACKLAEIDEFIQSLPEKFDTIVGERGTTVSGGQKQRFTLARAILRKPRILILDDATSSVDVDTEYEILSNLKRLFGSCTTFIITQRLSTVRNADEIYVLEKGRIAERGTHADLMELDGIYANLYKTITYSPAITAAASEGSQP